MPQKNSGNLPELAPQHREVSKQQKSFEKLLKQIKKHQAEVQQLQEQIPWIKQLYHEKVYPTELQYAHTLEEFTHVLIDCYSNIKLKTEEQAYLREFILENLFQLIDKYKKEHLKPFYTQFDAQGYSFEQRKQQDLLESLTRFNQQLKATLGENFTIDVEKYKSLHQNSELTEQFLNDLKEIFNTVVQQETAKKAKQKKTRAQERKEALMEIQKEQLNKTLRTLYTNLAKELHPDLEQDEEKKKQKNNLMQQVSEAYSKNDIFTLLKIQTQLQAQKKDTDLIGNITDNDLKFLNNLLKEQLDTLKTQISVIYQVAVLEHNPKLLIDLGLGKTEKTINQKINQAKYEFEEALLMIRQDINLLKQPQSARKLIKENYRAYKKNQFINEVFNEILKIDKQYSDLVFGSED